LVLVVLVATQPQGMVQTAIILFSQLLPQLVVAVVVVLVQAVLLWVKLVVQAAVADMPSQAVQELRAQYKDLMAVQVITQCRLTGRRVAVVAVQVRSVLMRLHKMMAVQAVLVLRHQLLVHLLLTQVVAVAVFMFFQLVVLVLVVLVAVVTAQKVVVQEVLQLLILAAVAAAVVIPITVETVAQELLFLNIQTYTQFQILVVV
jgi:hypothetical protein